MHPATVLHDIWRRPHLAKTVRVLKLEQSRPQYKNPPLHQIRECQQALVDRANAISDTLWVTAEEQECLLKGNPSVALWLLLALLPNLQDAELIGRPVSHTPAISCHVSESLRPFDRSRHRGRLLNEDLPNLFGQEREVKYTVPRDGKIVKLVWTYPNNGGPNGNEFEKIRRQISQKHRKSEDKPDIINREILDAIRKALPTPSKKFWNDVPANSYVDCTVR
ncbi:MAG: hypothetical protein Q9159_005537 [Coniocarpon cinnabarinum]